MDNPPSGGIGMQFTVGATPELEQLPLRLVLVGDFSGAQGRRATAPLAVSRDTFKQVLADRSPAVELEVHNHLSRRPATRWVKVSAQRLRDLEPAGLVAQVPELSRVSQLIEQLEANRKGAVSMQVLDQALAACQELDALDEVRRLCREVDAAGAAPAPAPAAAPAGTAADQDADDAVSRILSMVDTKSSPADAGQTRARSAVGSLVSHIAGGSKPGSSSALGQAARLAREVLGRQVDAILHHPELQALEATWRGLRLLVGQTDFRKGVFLELVDCSRDELVETLERQVTQPELEQRAEVAPALVGLDFVFSSASGDVKLLQQLAQQAEQIQVPLLVSVGHEFFGAEDAAAATRLPYVGRLLEGQRYIKWNALRDKDCARWLGVAFNRLLLRSPHGARGRGSIGVEEAAHGSEQHLWGSAVWAVASLVTRSHARAGWPTEITGQEHGALEDLPIHEVPGDGGRAVQVPLESYLPDKLAKDLAAAGIMSLSCPPQGDSAYLLRAPVLHRPEHYSEQDATADSRRKATLPYQLLVARVADLLGRSKDALVGGDRTEAEIQQALQAFLLLLIADTGPEAGVGVELSRSQGRLLADLHLRTGRKVMNSVSVNFTIGV